MYGYPISYLLTKVLLISDLSVQLVFSDKTPEDREKLIFLLISPLLHMIAHNSTLENVCLYSILAIAAF